MTTVLWLNDSDLTLLQKGREQHEDGHEQAAEGHAPRSRLASLAPCSNSEGGRAWRGARGSDQLVCWCLFCFLSQRFR